MPAISKLAALGVALLLTSPAQAWRVDIWEGQQCTSAELSSQEIADDVSNAQCYSIPVDAESATVVKESGDSDNNNIEFYTGGNCDSSNYAASTDSGCVDFEQTGATNYMLQTDQSNPGRKVRIKGRRAPALTRWQAAPVVEKPWWTSLQEQARQKLNITAAEGQGSLAADWDPTTPVQAGYGHGNVTEKFGKTWKWQQVALGMTIGIPLEEWDDKIHVKNDRFIVYGHDDYDLLEKRDEVSALDSRSVEKRWNSAQCRAVINCGRELAGAGATTFSNGWAIAVKAAYKLKDANESFTNFAKDHPWFVTIAGTVSGYGLGYAHTKQGSSDTKAMANCSGDTTQQQTWIQTMTTVTTAGNKNAATATISFENGDSEQISGEVLPKSSYDSGNVQCDADGKN